MDSFLGFVPHISQPAVAQAVSRGEKLADEKGWQLQEVLNRNL